MAYKKLRPTIKKNWVKALRSGKYLQTSDSLVSPDHYADRLVDDIFGGPHRELVAGEGFCCLGVECDISPKVERVDDDIFYFKKGHKPMFTNDDGWGDTLNAAVASSGVLPTEFRDYIGLSEKAEHKLISMNDNGKTFDEIADWIEKHL